MSFPSQGYVPTSFEGKQTTRPLIFQRDDFSATDEEEYLASDLVPTLVSGESCIFEVHLSQDSDKSNFQYTLDGGISWSLANDGKDVKDFKAIVFELPVVFGDLVNFRSKKAATVMYFRIVAK